jgi:carboxylesterase
MRPLAQGLNAAGFRVDLPRLPGHGTDPKDLQRTRYADWRGEVVRSVERLARDADHVALVGLSMGASLSLDVASSLDRSYLALVCINPQILDRGGALVAIAPLLEKVVPMAPASLAGLRKDDIAKPGVSEYAYDWVPVAAGNSFTRELPRLRKQAAALGCPLLVAHSTQDHSVPPENSAALLRIVNGAEELLLERSFHVATLDYDLELLLTRITAFFDRALARSAAPGEDRRPRSNQQ